MRQTRERSPAIAFTSRPDLHLFGENRCCYPSGVNAWHGEQCCTSVCRVPVLKVVACMSASSRSLLLQLQRPGPMSPALRSHTNVPKSHGTLGGSTATAPEERTVLISATLCQLLHHAHAYQSHASAPTLLMRMHVSLISYPYAYQYRASAPTPLARSASLSPSLRALRPGGGTRSG